MMAGFGPFCLSISRGHASAERVKMPQDQWAVISRRRSPRRRLVAFREWDFGCKRRESEENQKLAGEHEGWVGQNDGRTTIIGLSRLAGRNIRRLFLCGFVIEA